MLVVLCACCLAAITTRPGSPASGGRAFARLSAKELSRLEVTTEWRRLLVLWHAMLDHSEHTFYDPEGFRALAGSLDATQKDLPALAKAGLLPTEVAADLADLLQTRYSDLETRHYATERYVSLSAQEAATSASQWVIGLELSLLRRAAEGTETDSKVVEAATSNLAFELTFLYHLRRFEEEAQRRRELQSHQANGKSVDWRPFDDDYQRRLSLLLEAYRRRKLPQARPVQNMMPYVLALTEARPPKTTPEPEPSVR